LLLLIAELREHWFSQRANRMINTAWPAAAAYYAHHLGVLREGAAGSNCPKSSDQPLVFTYRGYLQSKGDAVIAFKPALVEDLSIHVEDLETEKQLSVATFSSGKRIAQALMPGGMESLMSRGTW
jgi:hypothetical protein